jgi:hypothetical protein
MAGRIVWPANLARSGLVGTVGQGRTPGLGDHHFRAWVRTDLAEGQSDAVSVTNMCVCPSVTARALPGGRAKYNDL